MPTHRLGVSAEIIEEWSKKSALNFLLVEATYKFQPVGKPITEIYGDGKPPTVGGVMALRNGCLYVVGNKEPVTGATATKEVFTELKRLCKARLVVNLMIGRDSDVGVKQTAR